jgi:hypothetical protein
MIQDYLKKIADTTAQGDAREESYYSNLSSFIEVFAESIGRKKIQITTLPKKTEAGNPDFRIWDGHQSIVGYIEAKKPGHYCKIATALQGTISIQSKIDKLFAEVEKKIIN